MTKLKMTLGGIMVLVTRWLLPPVCREHVLGDLHERYRSPWRFMMDAAGAVPAAMIGQILKATPPVFIAFEAILVYASFFVAGYTQRSLGPIWADAQPSQLAAMTVIVMTGLLWRDTRGIRPAWYAFKQTASLRQQTGLKLTPFWLRLIVTLRLGFSVYQAIGIPFLFAGVPAQLHGSHLFPGIMTDFRGIFLSTALIWPLRIWLGMRRKNRGLAT